MKPAIRIRHEILAQLIVAARTTPNEECCGLLAGRDAVITAMYLATNVLASAHAYEIAPAELFCVMREIRSANAELLGIYHSHPTGENRPSRIDVERAFYPEAAYFILSPQPNAPAPVRAFRITHGAVTELRIAAP
jgi:[CysO sulfur-carrier protein]-S-L-cysteine hydrolase